MNDPRGFNWFWKVSDYLINKRDKAAAPPVTPDERFVAETQACRECADEMQAELSTLREQVKEELRRYHEELDKAMRETEAARAQLAECEKGIKP